MRITTSIIMFYTWLTAAANLLESTGIAGAMGVKTPTSVGQEVDQAVEAFGSVTGTGGAQETLLGVFSVVTNAAEAFTAGLTAGPRIMAAMGVPPEIVVFLHAPLGLLAARFGVYMLSGREA